MAPTIDISSWFDQEAFSDVTLRFSGREVKCHKIILSNASEYFKTLFKPGGGFAESDQKVIELKGDPPDAVDAMIRFVYSFDYNAGVDQQIAQNSPSHHLDIYKAGHKYLLPSLQAKSLQNLSVVLVRITPINGTILQPKDIFELVKLLAAYKHYEEQFGVEMRAVVSRNLIALFKRKDFRAWMEDEGASVLDLVVAAVKRGCNPLNNGYGN